MPAIKPQFHVLPTGIRAKLTWSFILMSCIPLSMLILVAAWFAFPYTRDVFPQVSQYVIDPRQDPTGATWWLWGVIILTVLIAVLGSLYLGVKIIEPVLLVNEEAKRVAADPNATFEVGRQEDELGELTGAISKLTVRIREDMTELKQFGEKTTQLNIEINKRMVALASLLQIGELISGSTEIETVLDMVVERLAAVEDQSFSFLSLELSESLQIRTKRARNIDPTQLTHTTYGSTRTLIDASHLCPEMLGAMWRELGQPNLIIEPVVVRGRAIGVLAFGNRAVNSSLAADVIDLVSIFVKQTSIALENEILLRSNKALAVLDDLTGAYNESYIRQRLDEEIKRAITYQRPCGLALFVINGLTELRATRGDADAERSLKKVAWIIQESVSAIDRVGRFAGNELVIVVPERSKRQVIELAEEIRRRVEFAFASSTDPLGRLTISGSVAENPIDGMTGEELLTKAKTMIANSGSRQNAVMV